MKRIVTLLLVVLMLGTGTLLHAQQMNRNGMLKQRIELAKLRQIQQNLQLDEATLIQFRPLYLRYERMLANIDFRSQNRLLNVNPDSLSNAEAEQLLTMQWKRAKQLIHVRERFYLECRGILSAQQLVKLYQSEAEIRQKVLKELGKRRGMN